MYALYYALFYEMITFNLKKKKTIYYYVWYKPKIKISIQFLYKKPDLKIRLRHNHYVWKVWQMNT